MINLIQDLNARRQFHFLRQQSFHFLRHSTPVLNELVFTDLIVKADQFTRSFFRLRSEDIPYDI